MTHECTIRGRVLYRPAASGPAVPAAGVRVATEHRVARTDDQGTYALPVTEGDYFIKVTAPRGYGPEGPWYRPLTPGQAGGSADFVLVPDARRDQDAFTFIQITDLHLRGPDGIWKDHLRRDLDAIMERWAGSAAFVAVTGDLADRARPEELEACRDVLREQPIPVFVLPGNHDYFGHGASGSGEAFRNVFGPGCYSFDWGPVHFVAYDSVTDGPHSPNRRWLAEDLSLLPPSQPVIMLVHYQLDDAFFRLWDRFAVVASISGHWHSSRVVHDGRRTHYNGPPLSFGGIDFSPRGYRVFHWRSGELAAETFALAPRQRRVFAAPPVRPSTPHPGPEHPFPAAGGGEARGASAGPPTAPGRSAAPLALEPVWVQRLPGAVHVAAPVLASDRLYISTLYEDAPGCGTVTCVDAAQGAVLWTRRVGDSVKNRLACAEKAVYGVTVTGTVFALDAETGAVLWRRAADDASRRWVFSAPAYRAGLLYAGSAGHFRCLDAATGEIRWVRNDLGADDWVSSYCSPVAAGSLVLAGFLWKGVGLVALDAATGATVWRQDAGRFESVGTTPAVDAGHAYVLYASGTLRKLCLETGAVLWEVAGLAGWTPGSPVVHGSTVWTVGGDGRIVACDTTDGRVLWAKQVTRHDETLVDVAGYGRGRAPLLATPLLLDGVLWVPCSTGKLAAIDAATGATLLEYDAGAPLLSAPAYGGGLLYVADLWGYLHAFRVTAPGGAGLAR